MDLELARAVFKRWNDGLPVAEAVFYKAASFFTDDPEAVLVEAKNLTKEAAEAPPKGAVKKPEAKAPEKPKANPVDKAISAAPPKPKASPMPEDKPAASAPAEEAPGPPAAPPAASEQQQQEEAEPSKEEHEMALNSMNAKEKIEYAAPYLDKDLKKRYSEQLDEAEKQMGAPIIDPTMLNKYIEEFKKSDQDMQKAFLGNFKQMSKARYETTDPTQQAQDPGAAAPQPGASNGQPTQ